MNKGAGNDIAPWELASRFSDRGRAYLEKNDYDKAIADFEEALRCHKSKEAKEDLEKAKKLKGGR